MTEDTPTEKKPDTLEEGLDEFLDQVGSELDPLQALANALGRCGKTQFQLDGESLFIGQGATVCEGLSIQETSRSCELFCTTCGISCEVRLLMDKPAGEQNQEEDEMDEFLGLVDSGGDFAALMGPEDDVKYDDDDGDDGF